MHKEQVCSGRLRPTGWKVGDPVFRVLRLGLVALLITASLATMRETVSAQAAPYWLGVRSFVGQVIGLSGSQSNPTRFMLQVKARVITFQVVADTSFTARSAEAEVE